MTTTNVQVHVQENITPTQTHLDRLLEDKPLEVQNKVLRFALESGMKKEDPAFRLVQYIGYLAVLTETAPEEWKELFKGFEQELKEWSQHHLEQLESAARQTETIKELALSCKSLGVSSSALTLTSETLIEQFRNLTPALNFLTNVEKDLQELSSTAQSLLQSELKKAVREELTTALEVLQLQKTLALTQQLSEISQTLKSQIAKEVSAAIRSDFLSFLKREIKETIEQTQEDSRNRAALNFKLSYWSWQEWAIVIGSGSLLVGFILWAAVQIFTPSLPLYTQIQIRETWERAGWSNTKLERIEKKLRIDPKGQK